MKTAKLALGCLLAACLLAACGSADAAGRGLGNGWQPERSLDIQYAENFAVDYYQGGLALITLSDNSRFLVVPEGAAAPADIDPAIVVLQRPIENIYLVATSAMCQFDALGGLGAIRLSGTKAADWHIENARQAMEAGDILYAGKYSAPDYERIMMNNCQLAIESTMIHHTPEVKEKLEDIGVPVLVDQSSLERHPLARTEWMKLYAVLLGREALAGRLFADQAAYVDSVDGQADTGKTVAFFYISSANYAVARKSGDYVTKMIELAGGRYVFDNLGNPESAASTVNLEMEEFYATAKEADYIIYNSTISGELASLDELIAKNSLLADFKAVRNNNVWCTGENLFQETTQLGLMIWDIRRMLTEDDINELNFMYRLQ